LLFSGQRAQPSPQFDGWLAEHDRNEHQFEHQQSASGERIRLSSAPVATEPIRQPPSRTAANDA
jgi:hypothetical protein